MNRKISVKLFAITALFFIFLIAAFIIFQTLVFQSYYEAKKLREFEAGFHHLYKRCLEEGVPRDVENAPNYLEAFEDRNNAKTAIVNASSGFIQISMLTNGNESRFFIDSILKENTQIENGIMMKEGTLTKEDTTINEDTMIKEPFVMSVPGFSMGGLPGTNSMASAIREFLTLSDTQNNQSASKSAYPVVFISDMTTDGVRNLIAAVQLNTNEDTGSYLLAVSSLQPVGEAVSVIKDLYAYFAVFAVILILLLAFVFSNMVSKPLIRLNSTAVKMAELDFSARCEEKKNDEIGSLAHNLNFLSDNLHRALTDLKIANSQLTEDIERERQLEKMRKEFVAGVSHELKTPISLIMGYAEGLKENLVDGTDKERYIGIISDETQRMGNLVNDMLDLSQLESGKFKLNIDEFFINELVEYIMRKFETLFAEKKLKVELQMPEENILVNADEFRIEQVINNFINNAIRHTPEQGLILINIADKQSVVRVEIENEGAHIEEGDLENIWQKFYKVEKSRNREAGGTGLGLAIVGNILQLHSASYGAENTATGVRFFFELATITS